MPIVIVHGTIEIKAGDMEEAVEISLEHVKRSREEAGCISHNVHIVVENPNRLVFYEQWQDIKALHNHFAVPESGEFVRRLGKLATTEPRMNLFASTKSIEPGDCQTRRLCSLWVRPAARHSAKVPVA